MAATDTNDNDSNRDGELTKPNKRIKVNHVETDATTTATVPDTTDTTDTTTTTSDTSTPGQGAAVTMVDTLSFLSTICGSLKKIKRTGWVRHNIPLPESDADHMHRCAMCAMIVTSQPIDPRDDYSNDRSSMKFHPDKIDGIKLLRMAVTHDVCESLAGDITPFCNAGDVANKHTKEHAAMEEIRRMVGDPLGGELFNLWKEYEEQETAEALYCKDIDKFEMVMQAYEYEKDHLKSKADVDVDVDGSEASSARGDVFTEPLRTFFVTTRSSMKSPIFRRLDAELRDKREAMLKELGWEVTEEERQQY